MHKTYNELCITPNYAHNLFVDFVFDLGFDALEEKENSIIVRSEDDLALLTFALKEYSKKLSLFLKKAVHVETKLQIKKNEDWIKKYQDSIQPVCVGDFYIRPDWEKEEKSKKNIIINPALAFGSGHHESTYGCILQLQNYIKRMILF